MKDSKDRIENIKDDVKYLDEYGEFISDVCGKLNEVIRKVNGLESQPEERAERLRKLEIERDAATVEYGCDHNFITGKLCKWCIERIQGKHNLDPSPEEECEHQWEPFSKPVFFRQELEEYVYWVCKNCKAKKRIILNSEGDAVGEVGGKE